MSIEILMPALSPTMTEGTLAKWLKKEGDKIEPGQVIAEIETDKATMEVEAVDEGIIGKILVAEGAENIAVGSLIAIILEEGEDSSILENYKSTSSTSNVSTSTSPYFDIIDNKTENIAHKQNSSENIHNSESDRIKASPLARRIAEQNNINLSQISGSGPHSRIIKNDVLAAIENSSSSNLASQQQSCVSGNKRDPNIPEFTVKSLSGMRKVIAKRLVESKQHVPHFYLSLECNLDKLMEFRSMINDSEQVTAKSGKISVNDFIIKASALALRDNPDANSSWNGDSVKYLNYVDISVAVAIDGGLVTPIVKNADRKQLTEISSEMKDLAKRAREGKLMPEEYQGGSFTISNLGMFGIKRFNAIINPPQSCIIAVGASEKRAVIIDDNIKIANMVDITLSCDHRVVDGAVGAGLLSSLKKYIENPLLMMV